MSERRNLSEAFMRKLEPPAKGERRIYDTVVPQLTVRLRANGKRRWYLTCRAGKRSRQLPLGQVSTYPEVTVETARDLARMALAELAKGADPVQTKATAIAKARETGRGGKIPLADALKLHLKELARRGRDGGHVRELERVTKLAIAAGVKDLASPAVAAKAREWLESLDVSEPTRHRYRVHLCAVGKTAMKNWPAEVLPRDPFLALTGQGVTLPPPPVFDPAEAVRLVGDTALALPGGRLWCFLLLSGCRFKEATWARWDRLNIDRATFDVVPPDAAEYEAGSRVKRMKPRTVHLCRELVELLTTWKPDADSSTPFIFPAEWRSRPHTHFTSAFRHHLAAIGIPLEGRRIHSLRHTRQTLGIAAGEDSLRLRLAMGHAGEDMGAHYGRLAMRWRGMLSSWNGELRLRDPVEGARIVEALGTTPRPAIDAREVTA